MTKFDFCRLFNNSDDSNSASKRRAKKQRHGRTCRIEELESRELLSVNMLNFDVFQNDNLDDTEFVELAPSTAGLTATAPEVAAAPLPPVNTNPAQLSTAEFNYLRETYADLKLSSSMTAYNITVITIDQHNDTTLRTAVGAATSGNNLIVIRTTAEKNGIEITGLPLVLGGNVTIVSLGTDNLTLDGNNGSRIFYINSGTNVGLGGLIITKGTGTGHFNVGYGGGIYSAGTLTLTNCMVLDCKTNNDGGGIYSVGALTVTNSIVSNNQATGISGGGIYCTNTLSMTNSTISHNTTAGGYSFQSAGAGIYSTGGTTLTVTNCTVSDNTAAASGGGIYRSGTAAITNCTISENEAGDYGGGIYRSGSGTFTVIDVEISENKASYGGGIYGSSVTVTDCTITGNKAISYNGGGINGDGTFTNCTITGNTARYGGGVYTTGTSTITGGKISENNALGTESNPAIYGGGIYHNSGILTITDCEVSGNEVRATKSEGYSFQNTNAYGGAIYATAILNITNCLISGNSVTSTATTGDEASAYGGGIFCNNSALTVKNCTVSGNWTTATAMSTSNSIGGGFYIGGTATVRLINSNISGNSATFGGGIFKAGNTTVEQHRVTNCTIVGNLGGGIYVNEGRLVLYNTIVAKNVGSGYSDVFFATAGTGAGDFNLIGDGTGQTATEQEWYKNAVNNNFVGTVTNPIDPLFVNIPTVINASTTGQNYNSTNWNLRLQANSSAIDAGNNARAVDADGTTSLTTDLDGNSRFIGIVDIGAYERAPDPPTNFRSTGRTANSVTLAWNTVSSTTGYQIQYRQTGSTGTWISVTVTGQSTATREITGLVANMSYDFQIRGTLSGNGYTGWSSPVVSERTLLATPANLRTTDRTTSSVTLAWNTVTGATGYEVRYSTNGTTWLSTNVAITGTTAIVSNLTNQQYQFQVRALNSTNENHSEWSASLADRPLLPPPTTLNISASSTAITATSVALNWSSVSGATGYEVRYSTTEIRPAA